LNSGSRGFFLCHTPALGKQASSPCMKMPGRAATAQYCHALRRRVRRHSLDHPSAKLQPSWCAAAGLVRRRGGCRRKVGRTLRKRRTDTAAATHGLGPENHVLPPYAPSHHAYPERAAAARVRLRESFPGKAARTAACVTSTRRSNPPDAAATQGPSGTGYRY